MRAPALGNGGGVDAHRCSAILARVLEQIAEYLVQIALIDGGREL